MEFDLENPLTPFQGLHSHSCPHQLFLTESDHMPSQNYSRSLQAREFYAYVRQAAISLIFQFSGSFDPLVSYLAVNYLDRFFSTQGMLINEHRQYQEKQWILRLLAGSCVSLAAKMMKTEFSLSVFQCDEGFIFDPQTIQRMEVLILGALKWRMRSVTPFSFFNFFISLLKLKDPPLEQPLKARAIEIIFKSQTEINLLEFKPSIIAASSLLLASHELLPLQLHCFRNAIFNCSFVNKESLLNCCQAMQGRAMEGYESVLEAVWSSDTAANVLDRHWSSSESEMTTNGADRDMKRRKMSSLDGNAFQLSQIQPC